MSSTSNPTPDNPDAVLTARTDERLAHVYEQIALADEQLARVTEQLSQMEHDPVPHPSVVSGPRPSHDRPALRGLVGLLLAACIGGVAFAAQTPHGEAARLIVARWAPYLNSAASPWLEKPGNSAQASTSTPQLASLDATAAQPASSAQAPAKDAAPGSAAMSPELTQLLQSMARDIATVEQGVEQLKANQERMAADNAREIEQLRANQEQIRLAARPPEKPSEQEQRPKTPMPSPRPVASATVKPLPKQPPQARARPQPVQLQPKQQ